MYSINNQEILYLLGNINKQDLQLERRHQVHHTTWPFDFETDTTSDVYEHYMKHRDS